MYCRRGAARWPWVAGVVAGWQVTVTNERDGRETRLDGRAGCERLSYCRGELPGGGIGSELTVTTEG